MAFAIFAGGFVISAQFYFAGRPFQFQEAVMSFLQSRVDNPRGYVAAALGTTLGALALWPAGMLFKARLRTISRWWTFLGIGLFRVGLLACSVVGLLSLAEVRALAPYHITMAFVAFIGLTSGLTVCLVMVAIRALPGRWWLAGLAAVLAHALTFQIYMLVTPDPPQGFGPVRGLAGLEWQMSLAIAVSTLVLTWSLRAAVSAARTS